MIAANHVGFADSTETPTPQGIFRGAGKTIAWALEQGLNPDDLKIFGISMGTTVAAHAASFLMAHKKFALDPEQAQNIRLLMANGALNSGVILDDTLLHYDSDVRHEKIDTGNEFTKMLRSRKNDFIFVSYIRGKEDALTPADQGPAHEQAATGLNFVQGEVEGKHFTPPAVVLSKLNELEVMKTPEVQRGGPGGY